ncbi:hypothetical protein SAMN04488564_1175 [Lentzea waywayandensis]|uniref:Uncharacterized protein n=1 Tax=Lentzea waywayandensis TaxID=84724 RepID=A0A1I6FGL8_9PSEU|nr:hypothetical protein [Lentzea waywayandensis]SFR29081.1 hypothetical protein SAMN04488564_1175 [Lentzea waywayandensis]
MSLRERKLAELADQVRGVDADFECWLEETADGKPLRKHNSQVRRLTEQLRGLVDVISAEMDAIPADGDEVLRQCRKVQRRVLEVHRIWDYYRSKLGQRYVSWYQQYLAAADEFTWECYRLGAEHLGKDTALVFLNGDFSPFTLDRGRQFTPERAGGQQSIEYLRFVTELPVPVIGLPWYQLAHLADMVLVAHEVGHVVWTDLKLGSEAETHLLGAVADLPGDRRDAWLYWGPEVFADLYGVLAAGPAYASALADLLAADPDKVRAEFPPESAANDHPPASLRIALVTKALRHNGFVEAADTRAAAWQENYPSSDPYLDDVDLVVPALLDGAYEGFQGATMLERVRFSQEQERQAALTAHAAAVGQSLTHTEDVRALVAAARLAFDRVPGDAEPQRAIVVKIQSVLDNRRRNEARRTSVPSSNDRAAGAALHALFEMTEKNS